MRDHKLRPEDTRNMKPRQVAAYKKREYDYKQNNMKNHQHIKAQIQKISVLYLLAFLFISSVSFGKGRDIYQIKIYSLENEKQEQRRIPCKEQHHCQLHVDDSLPWQKI